MSSDRTKVNPTALRLPGARRVSNYATLYVKDVLTRIDGVGDVNVLGARDYSMRIWLDPDKVAARGLTGTDHVDGQEPEE